MSMVPQNKLEILGFARAVLNDEEYLYDEDMFRSGSQDEQLG